MLTTSVLWIVGAAILGSLFWCSARECVTLLLTAWTVAVGILVYSDLSDRFLWIPVLLALLGVFGSVLVLASRTNVMLAANIAILVLFTVSVDVLKDNRRSSIALMRRLP